jgi:hypothetical protein
MLELFSQNKISTNEVLQANGAGVVLDNNLKVLPVAASKSISYSRILVHPAFKGNELSVVASNNAR